MFKIYKGVREMELRERGWIVIDTETTGLDSEKNQILEVAILVVKKLEVVDCLSVKIKHKEYTVSTKALEVNKINLIDHEKTAYTEKEAVERILCFLRQYKEEQGMIAVGQNVQFDIKFMESMFLRHYKIKDWREVVSYRTFDLMGLALVRNIEDKVKLEKLDLDSITKAVDMEIIDSERHTAMGDAEITYEAIIKLLEM